MVLDLYKAHFYCRIYRGCRIWNLFLLFGENSLEVLLNNISLKNELLREVNDLQAQNAKLQKDLFELKGLEP